jgi:O-antigen/teichoic acid export membrane protein
VGKRTASSGLGSLGRGVLTASSTLVVTGASALAGVIIAHELGRTDETDGFFAAYGVFVVIVLAAQAIRIGILPELARARASDRLASEVAGFATAFVAISIPILLVAELAARPIAEILTGNGSDAAQYAATETLRWVIPAALAQLFAGLAASALAALDDYAIAAAGYASGSVLGIALILARVGSDGFLAVAWGVTLNAAVTLAVPIIGLAWLARRRKMPSSALRPTGPPVTSRIGSFATATAVPLALQLMYVMCLPFAARDGIGAQTSFAYAYIGAAALVSVTASSLGLVTSVPLARAGVDAPAIARHVISTSWLALIVIGAVAGMSAVAGSDLVAPILGSAYGGHVGAEIARLVLVFSPWIVISVGVTTAFPLVFVMERTRALPLVAVLALIAQLPLAWAGQTVAGLYGLAFSLALSAGIVLAGLLRVLGVLGRAARGLALAAGAVSALAVSAYAPPALVLESVGAAAVGLALYVTLVAVLRPSGLTSAWQYLRALR